MIMFAMIMKTFDTKDEVVLMIWIGVKLTIFFRRKFNFLENKVCHLLNPMWIGGILLLFGNSNEDVDWIQIMHKGFLVVSVIYEMCVPSSIYGGIDKSSILNFFIVPCHLGINYCFMLDLYLCHCNHTPSALKVYLRTPRTICGPSYSILLIAACYKGSEVVMTSFIWLPTLLKIASVSSFVATMFFRPDNHSIYMLLLSLKQRRQTLVPDNDNDNNNTKNHKFIHAGLMVLSHMCMIIKFILWNIIILFALLGSYPLG